MLHQDAHMWTIDSIISIMDITIELLEPGYKIAGNSFFFYLKCTVITFIYIARKTSSLGTPRVNQTISRHTLLLNSISEFKVNELNI